MNEEGYLICCLNIQFLRYTEMIATIDKLFSFNSDKYINKFKISLSDLKQIKFALKDCLKECERQINFLENFLNDCGVNVYEV